MPAGATGGADSQTPLPTGGSEPPAPVPPPPAAQAPGRAARPGRAGRSGGARPRRPAGRRGGGGRRAGAARRTSLRRCPQPSEPSTTFGLASTGFAAALLGFLGLVLGVVGHEPAPRRRLRALAGTRPEPSVRLTPERLPARSTAVNRSLTATGCPARSRRLTDRSAGRDRRSLTVTGRPARAFLRTARTLKPRDVRARPATVTVQASLQEARVATKGRVSSR